MWSRVCIAAVVLVIIQVVVLQVRRTREPDEIRMPSPSLHELPQVLGPWKGHEVTLDPRVTAAVQAMESVDRAYDKDGGGRVVVEVAAFDSNELDPPHMPQVCYVKAGWTIKGQKDVRFKNGDDTCTARLLSLEQEGQHQHVLYWYQLDDAQVLDARAMRTERWKLFGRKTWPPLVKVMIQTSLAESPDAEEQLTSFASLIFGWIKQVR